MDNGFCRALNDKLTPDERIFKFRSAEIDDKLLTVTLMVGGEDYDHVLTDRLREKVRAVGQSILPKDVMLSVVFRKIIADERLVVKKVMEYVFHEHKSVYPAFQDADYKYEPDGDYSILSIKIDKYVCDYAKSISLAQKLHDALDLEFMEEIEIAFLERPDSEINSIKPIKVYSGEIRLIKATPTNVLEKGVFDYPRYIVDILEKEKEENNLTLCGVISGIRTRRLLPKTERAREKILFTFLLNDTTGKIKCKFFARVKDGVDWESLIVDGGTYLMNGLYAFDSFDNKYVFVINGIAEAEIDYSSINMKSNFNFDFGRYLNILPEPYNTIAQNDLFDVDMTDLSMFKGTEYVVFDLETTGLDIENDEIIELAGIKIVDGQFTEKFSTFVHPTEPIPKEATKKNNITNEMVEFAPLLGDVIPDFYRFCKGCTLVGHNILAFDIPLLNNQAKKVRYEFDNPAIDTYILAKQKMRLAKYNLSALSKALNIPLIDAHRALNDVTANAQVFLKLMKMR